MKETKVAVTEKNFTFLKKVQGLKEEILIKRVKITEKGKEEKEVNVCLVADEYVSYLVQATQLAPVFVGEKFGLKNIKAFLKAVTTYGEMAEKDNEIVFSSDKKKTTYRKLDESTIQPCKLPEVDLKGYVAIQLLKEETKEIGDGLRENPLSDYASLSITAANKLMMQIGEMTYDNLFVLEIKDIVRKETNAIKFLTKASYLTRLFGTLDEDSKVTLFLKADSPLICVEKSEIINIRTYIAPVSSGDDEEKIDEIVDETDDE